MRLRSELFVFVLLCSSLCMSQKTYNARFDHLSNEEKKWIRRHPATALKVKRMTKEALQIVEQVKKEKLLDLYENGGLLDAFRHTFTMAYLAQKISVRKLRSLGIAHEKGNYEQFKKGMVENGEVPDSLSGEMDLKNNELGFLIGSTNKNISPDSLKIFVVEWIKRGGAWYIARNQYGRYVDCAGKEIVLDEWKGKWNIPKCMRRTNE
jgi:hypothetical protein